MESETHRAGEKGKRKRVLETHQDILQSLLVLVVLKVRVRPLPVPRVKRVIPDHVERRLRQGRLGLAHLVKVLVVAPREHDVVKSASFRVAAELGRVDWVVEVGVLLEGTGVDDLVLREGGTDDKGVSLKMNEKVRQGSAREDVKDKRDSRRRPTVPPNQRSRAACRGRARVR